MRLPPKLQAFDVVSHDPLMKLFAQIAARQLAMPFLVAWRIGLSVTVPLIVLGTILETLDMPLHDTFGAETALTIWTALAAGMAFWAGVLANAMYMQPRRTAPRRGI